MLHGAAVLLLCRGRATEMPLSAVRAAVQLCCCSSTLMSDDVSLCRGARCDALLAAEIKAAAEEREVARCSYAQQQGARSGAQRGAQGRRAAVVQRGTGKIEYVVGCRVLCL